MGKCSGLEKSKKRKYISGASVKELDWFDEAKSLVNGQARIRDRMRIKTKSAMPAFIGSRIP